MTEFIGSRISLISKRDIRYVGTLHEISSENSTVSLENVVSFGTEGRRPDEEVAASDSVFDYIVFRGSDVKDLRIEEAPREPEPPQPKVPDDPAILGSGRRPTSASVGQPPHVPLTAAHGGKQGPQQQQAVGQQNQHQQRQQPPPFVENQFPYGYPPPNPRFGPYGFPPGPPNQGFPVMPYGTAPGWHGPPGYGFPPMPSGQFAPHPQMPIGPPSQQHRQPMPHHQQAPPVNPAPIGPAATKDENEPIPKVEQPGSAETAKVPSSAATPVPEAASVAPHLPTETKPDVEAALAPPAAVKVQADGMPSKAIASGPKVGRIVPVIPLTSPAIKPASAVNSGLKATFSDPVQASPQSPAPEAKAAPADKKTAEETNRDARAAVAEAMAKLSSGQKRQTDESGVDNLTRKVNEMRTNDNLRTSRQAGAGGNAAGHRGGRGGGRGGREQGRKVDVPKTDFDFESSNAKFNKQDMVKEAIATGSPLASPTDQPPTNGSQPTHGNQNGAASISTGYNKSASFFDDISSEIRDRAEGSEQKMGGREFRHEERRKNLDTFGQASVDNGYRHGRGRGRGRGQGRGRGGGRGRANGIRGGQGSVAIDG